MDRAETVLHRLLDERRLSWAERDYLEILGNLIEDYEKLVHPVKLLPSAQKAGNVDQNQGSYANGGRSSDRYSRVDHIGTDVEEARVQPLANVEKLCAYFGLNPSAFIKVPKDVGVIVSS